MISAFSNIGSRVQTQNCARLIANEAYQESGEKCQGAGQPIGDQALGNSIPLRRVPSRLIWLARAHNDFKTATDETSL